MKFCSSDNNYTKASLRHSDILSKTVQESSLTSCQGKEIGDLTLQKINSLLSESKFELLWQKTVQQAVVLEITKPSLPSLCMRNRPAKLLNENEASLYDEVSDVKTFYRCIYFDTTDTATNCIKARFLQPEYIAIKNIEQLILNVMNGLEYQNQIEDVLSDYGEEINHYRLSAQLQILKTNTSFTYKHGFN